MLESNDASSGKSGRNGRAAHYSGPGKVISGNSYAVRTVDEDGVVYECPIKPYRQSDKALLNMLLSPVSHLLLPLFAVSLNPKVVGFLRL